VSILPKRRTTDGRTDNRYTATDVLALIGEHGGSVSWRQLTALAGADNPKAITQLRQMLKGLQRNGELERDHEGTYHLPESGDVVEAIVEQVGRRFSASGVPIEDARNFSLRAGDAVQMRVVDGRGRITRVISHADTPVTGVLRKQGRYPYVEGIGVYRGRVSLFEPPPRALDGDTVLVRITDRDRRGLVGTVVDVLTHENVLDQAIDTALSSAQIPHEWPAEVDQAAAKLPKSVDAHGHRDRVDLTACPLVTIDGETARDYDDAVYAEALPGRNGGYRLCVAIADVGHYVKSNGVLDREAQQRSTSVYFPERVVPMLPEQISNGLCSLLPLEHRLAMVCDMRIDRQGSVAKFEFYEALIYSHARLTYNQVQDFLDGGSQLPVEAKFDEAVANSVRALNKAHNLLRQARDGRGALDFETHEAVLALQNGRVVGIEAQQRLSANQLIEEAMIAANVCAARFLEANETPALYRVHEPPDADKVEELRHAFSHVGVRLAPGDVSPKALQGALSRLPAHADKWVYAQLTLRTLQQAIYTPRNQGHFGLALERYMHFTSPIRRYPDLVVHRAIKAVLARQQNNKARKIPSFDELQSLGELCSTNERRAESAGWLVDAWLKCDYLRDEMGSQFEGVVAGVTEFGLFVDLEGYFVQGLLHISNLGQDFFHFDSRTMALVGERSGKRFALGDHLDVVIRDIDPPQGRIDLLLAGSAETFIRGRKERGRKERGRKEGGRKEGGRSKGKRR